MMPPIISELLTPTTGYLTVTAAFLVLLLIILHPRSVILKTLYALCFGLAAFEVMSLPFNPWGLLLVFLSPLAFYFSLQEERFTLPGLAATLLLLGYGGYILFIDPAGRPAVSPTLASVLTGSVGLVVWILLSQRPVPPGKRRPVDAASVVGLVGTVRTGIEKNSPGMVLVEKELWPARSSEPIPAGRKVRVVRHSGGVLTVKVMPKPGKQ